MKRIRFTEEQIIALLREHEAGAKTADLARKHAVSEATLYNWKAKYGGLDVPEAKRPKGLEEENRKLKKLLRWRACCYDSFTHSPLILHASWRTPPFPPFTPAISSKCVPGPPNAKIWSFELKSL